MKSIITLLLNDRRCNFNCEYCYARNDHTKGQPINEIKDFHAIDFLYENKLKQDENVEFETTFWGGEPFANPHLKEIVKYLKDIYNSKFFTVTNGSLLNDNWVDWCIENNFKVAISNDLAYQKNRGFQYLDDNKAIARLCNAGLVSNFQFVLSKNAPDLLKQLEYHINWCEKMKVEKVPHFGFLPIKAYDEGSKHLLFNKNSEESKIMQNSLYEYIKIVLLNKDNLLFKNDYNKLCLNAIYGMQGQPRNVFVKDGMRKSYATCSLFRDHCFDLTGREWSCPHFFERDPNTPYILPEYTPDKHCIGCSYIGECNEICPSADHESRVRSCESLKMIYRTIRQAIYDFSDEETKKTYVPESIKDLRLV